MIKKRIILFIFFIIVVAITGKILFNKNIEEPIEVSVETGKDINASLKTEIKPKKNIVVHVKGNVKNSGVYTLKEGDRIIDAVKKAGGATKNANLDAINLASILKDGQAVYIPSENEVIEADNNSNNKVNINNSSKEVLTTLPGIGDAIAEEIIEYRKNNGLFTSIEEIKNVKRIGDKTFENICDKITID